ncbi:MAG TPA: hypothetical protein VFT32_08630 [Candidatus Eisenbacteria bacterium]|nr:hypothetical protein [Candidatus Eisenbacteria bacterium]
MRSRSRSRAASTSASAARLAGAALLSLASALAAVPAARAAAADPAPTNWPFPLALPDRTPLELGSLAGAGDPAGAGGDDSAPIDFATASAAASGASSGASARREEAAKPRTGKRKALLYSLLLPGAGELSLGAKGRAVGFFVAEGLIWTHYVWFQVAGHLRRDDYIEQAQLNAGVGIDSADDEYWKIVGQYERSSGSGPGSYEETVRREARDLYPDDPAAQDAYVSKNLPSGDRAWNWSSEELQRDYRTTRNSSNRAFDRAKYSFAAAILNRLVSAVDTQILHRRLSKDGQANLDEGTRLLADATPDGGARLLLLRRF